MADLDNGRLQGRGILVPAGVREGAAAAPRVAEGASGPAKEELETIEYPEEAINPEDIPF